MHTPLIRSPSTNLLTNSAAFSDAFCKGEVVSYLLRLTEEEKLGSEGGGVRGEFYTHIGGLSGSYSTQYFKPRSVRGAQKGAAR